MSDAGLGPRVTDLPGTERDGRDDAGLVAQSVHAPECFAALFDRHASAVHRYATRRLGPDAADDLVAETFLIAFQRRAGYDGTRADALPWLYGIATNLIGRHRRDEVRLLRAVARTGAAPAPADTVAEQATSRVAAQALRRQLASALAGLPGGQRDVLLLVASGLSLPETALALGVPLGTVASRLARARRKVREALGGTNPVEIRED
jgi:RNA polymerase sigma factor (sigma-70 family)